MNHQPDLSSSLTNAMYDLGMPGIVLLIVACGVLVLAYTRDLRTAISTTLGIAFVAAASGWVFQVAAKRQSADSNRVTQLAVPSRAETVAVGADNPGRAAPSDSINPIAKPPAQAVAELLRIALDEESPDVAVYQVAGPLAAEDTSLVDQLIEAACPTCRFSLATDGKRIYAHKQAEGEKPAQTLQGLVLTRQSALVTFKALPRNEQLEAVGGIVHKLAAKAKLDIAGLDATEASTWSGTGVTRTLSLASAASTSAEPVIAGDDIVKLLERRQRSANGENKPPAWIALADQSGQLVDGAYVKVASSGRFLTVEQCRPSLNEAVAQEVNNYVRMRLGPQAERIINVPQKLIDEQIVSGPVAEENIASTTVAGGGKRLHALLVFDQKVQEDLKSLYREAQVQRRSLLAISLVAAALLVLAAVYGYLKVDALTHNRYRLRLQAAALLLMGLAGAGALWAFSTVAIW